MNRTVLEKKLKKRLEILEKSIYSPCIPFSLSGTISSDEGRQKSALTLQNGTIWSGAGKTFTLFFSGVFPARPDAALALVLELGLTHVSDSLSFMYGPEATVILDGSPLSGCDPNHSIIRIPAVYLDGKEHQLQLDGWIGLSDEPYQVGFLGLAEINEPVQQLYDAASVCYATALNTRDNTLSDILLDILNTSMDMAGLLFTEPDSSRRVTAAAEYLRNELAALPKASVCGITACGHGHIDLAWLWRTSVTRKKAARTFLNVLRLMERYEPFFFSQTQAQLYKWIEEDYPEIFEQVTGRIAQGRWELLGSMWVESDCNITGAESLVRQFLLYHLYTKEKFGTSGSPVVWLPDTFGFCAQLPQLMKSAGAEAFATAKMTWNQYNKLPSESFIWRGLDGTEILSHVVSVAKPCWFGGTYSADLTPEELLTTVSKAENRIASKNMLLAYGMGDGGGGPTEAMLRRAEQLSPAYPGLPGLELGTFGEFFKKLAEEKNLPLWEGELYLELHRGTYTSQSAIKRRNRQCETELNRAEFLSAWANLAFGAEYPSRKLRECWELLCLNQFHDILPGSSIAEVYTDAERDHEQILETCGELCCKAVAELEERVAADADMVIVNSNPFSTSSITKLPFALEDNAFVCRADGSPLVQYKQGDKRCILTEQIPAYGYSAYRVISSSENVASLSKTEEINLPFILENELISVCFDRQGDIVSLVDKADARQLIPEGGRAAQWKLYDDLPGDWDAWDIDEDYVAGGHLQTELVSASVLLAEGGVQQLTMTKKVASSTIIEVVSLYPGARNVDFHCDVDFRENHKMLRISNEVDIHSAYAEYACQFGSVLRPTTRNTSWEQAKFECCMQGWVDLCEGDYGVALACDNKYGVSVQGRNISLAVVRSASFPDENADRGQHEFSFSLIPHRRSYKTDILRRAYALKRPMQAFWLAAPKGKNWEESFVSSGCNAIVIESIKKEENGSGLVIRAYESCNSRGYGTISFNIPFSSGVEADILENSMAPADIEGGKLGFSYRPYEIKTFILNTKE